MRRTLAALLIVASVIAHERASAQELFGYFTVDDYRRASVEKQVGYTAGLFDAFLWMFADIGNGSALHIAECLGDESDTGLSLLYDGYLEEHAEKGHWPAAEVFLQMLFEHCLPEATDPEPQGETGRAPAP